MGRGDDAHARHDLQHLHPPKLAVAEPEVRLTVPETLMGGPLFHVAKEYAMEDYRDRHPVPAAKSGLADPKVWFAPVLLTLTLRPQQH